MARKPVCTDHVASCHTLQDSSGCERWLFLFSPWPSLRATCSQSPGGKVALCSTRCGRCVAVKAMSHARSSLKWGARVRRCDCSQHGRCVCRSELQTHFSNQRSCTPVQSMRPCNLPSPLFIFILRSARTPALARGCSPTRPRLRSTACSLSAALNNVLLMRFQCFGCQGTRLPQHPRPDWPAAATTPRSG